MSDPSSPLRVVDAPLQPPTAEQGLVGVVKQRYLLKLLVKREVSARYQGSFLGLLWSYINPLSQFFIYFVVMGVIFNLHNDIDNFAIHIFAALIIVHYFTETFNAGTRSIQRNKSLVRKMAVPKEMFPVASMLVSLYHVGPQLVILVLACSVSGWVPDPTELVAFALALAIIMTLGTGLALLFSAANVYFRDFGSAVGIMTNFVRFGVPMIYPYSQVHDRFHGHIEAYLSDPIAIAVLLFQRAFWVGTISHPRSSELPLLPDHLFQRGLIALVVSLIVLVVCQLVFSRLQDKLPERMN